MTGKQMIRLFVKHGWKIVKIRGSHYTLVKGDLIEQIPHHTTELKKSLEIRLLKKLQKGDE